jgi:hypothetical protein
MKTKMRRTLTGGFRAQEHGAGAWQLGTGAPGGAEIHIGGAEPGAAHTLRGASPSAVTIEWRADGALVTLVSEAGSRSFIARSATIHEPVPDLYRHLPLANFDEAARRFWRRVFRLVRIPGGRHLLGLIARRTRGPR